MKRRIRKSLNVWLSKAGYELKRIAPGPTGELANIAFRLFQLQHPNDLVFQIGASDGQFNDPIAELLRRGPNPALLLEPDPCNFAALVAHHRGFPHVKVVNAAIGETDGFLNLYTVRREGRWLNSPHASQLSSLSRRHLLLHGVLEKEIEAVRVPSLRVGAALDKHAKGNVGFVLSDSEGYDRNVVEQILDLGLRPSYVCFEFMHIMQDLPALCSRLEDCGYLLLFDKQNCLAYRDKYP